MRKSTGKMKKGMVQIANMANSKHISQERFQALVEKSTDVVALLDAKRKVLYTSPATVAVLGYQPSEITSMRNPFQLIHPLDSLRIIKLYTDVLATPRKEVKATFRLKHKNGEYKWVDAIATNYLKDPRVGAIVLNFRDITLQKEEEKRQEILNKISVVLMASFDHELTLKEVANHLVPDVADYCRIVTVDEHKHIKEISVNHVERKKMSLVEKLYDEYKDQKYATYGVESLLRTGKPELMANVPKEAAKILQKNKNLRDVIDALGLISYMGIPLIARGKVIGALTLSSVKKDHHYSVEDLQFAQQIGQRIALAIDNAHLYQASQEELVRRKKLEKQKDDFVAIASHELKTPVTSIKAYAQVLERRFEKEGNTESAQLIRKMDTQLNKLTGLIGDLLDVTKIESGKLQFHESLFLTQDLVEEIVEEVQRTTEKHTISIQGKTKGIIEGDRERIGQVITNLLANAVKYSPKAKKINVKIQDEKNGVSVGVQDFGVGIPKENQAHVFERFFRGNGPQQDTFPGLGLGLYISKEIVKRQGGSISVQSTEGKGSTFCIWLPLAKKQKTSKLSNL